MMDGEMDATAVNSKNPLDIPEVLDNILGLLPVKDLKSCRLVNRFWKDTALKPMRKKCAEITFGRTSKFYYRLEDMETFLQCFSKDPACVGSGLLPIDPKVMNDIPCTKFEIYTNIINTRSSGKEKSIVDNFLHAISPLVTKIVLHGGRHIGGLLKGVEKLEFPSLKRIVIGIGACAFSPWMSGFITNAEHLEKLELNSAGDDVEPFFQFLLQNKGLKIKELSIRARIENKDLLVLIESDLKLKSLTLEMNWAAQEPINLFHANSDNSCIQNGQIHNRTR